MSSLKARYLALKSKHGGTAKKLFGGLKETAIDAGGGAAAGALEDFVMPHLPSQLSSGWGKVATMAIAGHLVRKKVNEWLGDGLVGAAGYVAYQEAKSSGLLASIMPSSAPAATQGAKGWYSGAGAFEAPYEGAGALMGGSRAGNGGSNAGAFMGARGIDDAR